MPCTKGESPSSQRLLPQNTHGGDIARNASTLKSVQEQFARLLNELGNLALRFDSLEAVIRENTFEQAKASNKREEQINRIEIALLLIYGKQLHSAQAQKVFNTIQISQDGIALMQMLAEEKKNLQMLREREARRGGRDNLSVGDIRDIERAEEAIERLELELHELEQLERATKHSL